MGLQINSTTGEIDVDQSTAGTYQVTRTVTNSNDPNNPSSATDIVVINDADNAAFSYSGSPFDINNATNPTPTVTGLSGGTFNSIDHFEFNGTDDFIDFPVQADFPDVYIMPQDPRTLSAWVNPSSIPTGGTTKAIIGNKLWKTAYYQGYALFMSSGGALEFIFWLNQTNVSRYFRVITTETLSTGNWYNVVVTDNGNLDSNTTSATDILNNYTIYINNVPATLTNISSGLPSGFIGSANNWYGARLNIGAGEGYTSLNNTTYFPGLISNASIFTESLTSAKVSELYNNGIPGNLSNHSSSSNLVGWWKLGNDATYNSSTSTWSFPNAANPGTGGGTSTSLPSTAIRTIDLNSTTGLISLSNSNVGTYGVIYNTTGATGSICPATSTQSVQLVNTNFDFPSAVCNVSGSPTILPTNFTQQTGGVFSISPTSGSPGIDATSGLLSPAGSTAGTYAITYTIGSNSTTKNITSGAVLVPSTTTNTSALSFNGTSSYIQASGVTDLNGLNTMSFSLWIKGIVPQANAYVTALTIADSTTNQAQFVFSQANTANNFNFYVRTSTGGVTYGTPATTGTGFLNGNWRHVVGTYDGVNIKLYVDGVLVSGGSISRTGNLITATGELYLGRSYQSASNFFDGEIDEVAVWDTVLTSCDAAGIYQASSNGTTADLSTIYPSNLKYYNRMGD